MQSSVDYLLATLAKRSILLTDLRQVFGGSEWWATIRQNTKIGYGSGETPDEAIAAAIEHFDNRDLPQKTSADIRALLGPISPPFKRRSV